MISQTENTLYDTYDSAVVCAPDAETARNMHPFYGDPYDFGGEDSSFRNWCSSADKVTVELLGEASPGLAQGSVCASFNAG